MFRDAGGAGQMRAKMKRYYHKHITGAPLECYIVAAENLAAAEHLEKAGFDRVSTKCLRRHFWDMNAHIVASGRSRAVSPFRLGEIRTLPEVISDRSAILGLESIGSGLTSCPRR